MQLLDGIKIVDFSRLLPGPLGTHLLAQMGAKVLKVESPKRKDYARAVGPQIAGASTLFHQLNHNKEILVVDYESEVGYQEILEHIKTADAVIEQFRPGAMSSWKLGYEELKLINPKLVYVSITGYGQSGSHRSEAGHDFNYLANSGIMSLIKDDQGKPILPGTQFSDIAGSYMSIIALQAGLLQRNNLQQGCWLNVPLSAAVNPFLAVPYSLYSGKMPHEQLNMLNGKTIVNYAAYQCADDKWISLGALELKFWNNFCDLVDKEDWKAGNPMELSVMQFDKTKVEDLFKTKTRDEWATLCKGKDVCLAPILEIEELHESELHNEDGTFVEISLDNNEKLNTISLPFSIVKP